MTAVNPVHGKPLWGLVRLGNDPDIDQEVIDKAPHLEFMFSDIELIALRVVCSASIAAGPPGDDERFARLLATAQSALTKLEFILNAELES